MKARLNLIGYDLDKILSVSKDLESKGYKPEIDYTLPVKGISWAYFNDSGKSLYQVNFKIGE